MFPEVICLCGSTKFKKEYLEVAKKLGFFGKITLTVACFAHADKDPLTEEQKTMLDMLHLRKIDMSDAIYVIDVDGYIGESTSKGIAYAKGQGKLIMYHSLTVNSENCPICGNPTDSIAVDIGVGIQHGPPHCMFCGWDSQMWIDEMLEEMK